VISMDQKVIRHLGIEENEIYLKSELVRLTAQKVRPDDLDYLCANCSWLPYGVCKEGIANVQNGNVAQKAEVSTARKSFSQQYRFQNS
jgi:uncharacterized protein